MLMPELDDRVIQVYKGVGKILAKYRSGKLPKAFKILPALRSWEEVRPTGIGIIKLHVTKCIVIMCLEMNALS